MPQLCLHNCNRCAAVNQFAGYAVKDLLTVQWRVANYQKPNFTFVGRSLYVTMSL
jgi:hypothetical protein